MLDVPDLTTEGVIKSLGVDEGVGLHLATFDSEGQPGGGNSVHLEVEAPGRQSVAGER